jgi:hypothetical protein
MRNSKMKTEINTPIILLGHQINNPKHTNTKTITFLKTNFRKIIGNTKINKLGTIHLNKNCQIRISINSEKLKEVERFYTLEMTTISTRFLDIMNNMGKKPLNTRKEFR